MLAYPMTGIGRYAFELLKALTIMVDAEWVLLSHCMVPPGVKAGFTRRVSWIEGDGRGRAEFWFQREVARQIGNRVTSHFLGLANSIPVRSRFGIRRTLVIYDLTFLEVPHLTQLQDLVKGFGVNLPAIVRADVLLAISGAVKSDVSKWLPWVRARLVALPPGGTKLTTADGCATEHRRGFLAVGAHRRKNTQVLLRAYAQLRPDVRLDHPLHLLARNLTPRIARVIQELRLDSAVRLHANASDEQLGALYRECVALVYPSRYEGLGLPVAEALLAGLPVVVPARSPMASLVGGGGLVVDPVSPVSLGAAMTTLATDTNRWNACAAATREVSSGISWTRVAEVTAEAMGLELRSE